MKAVMKLLVLVLFSNVVNGQMVLNPQGVTTDNICTPNTVYYFLPDKPRPVESYDTIEARLNKDVSFAKENPGFKANPTLQFAVNCKGEPGGGFHMINSSGNSEVDRDLIDFFKTIEKWNPGKLKETPVDSWFLWNIDIKNGFFYILNH
jgi:hypothetical protein